MDASQTKSEFIFVGAMYAGVWACAGWLGLIGCFVARGFSLCDIPGWMFIATTILGFIFTIATIALFQYCRRLRRVDARQ